MKTSVDKCFLVSSMLSHDIASSSKLDKQPRSKKATAKISFGPDFVTAFLVEIDLLDEQIVTVYLIEEDLKTYNEVMESINSNFSK